MEKKHIWTEEGSRGFTMEEAMVEAQRCLHCANPFCREGCPINNDIPAFTKAIAEGNFGLATDIIRERSNLPSICGRVCPKEKQCEGHCIMHKAQKPPIQIGKLESFATEFTAQHAAKKPRIRRAAEGRVAVVGSGPASLSVARELSQARIDVTVFEAQAEPGGVLMYGIPEFRLAKDLVRQELQALTDMGVSFVCNTKIGVDKTIDDLFAEGFDAVFLGTGTTVASKPWIDGLDLPEVSYALDLLTKVQMAYNGGEDPIELAAATDRFGIHKDDVVLVIGAGNVAMDAARTAKRLGADTRVVYRRGPSNMTCLPSEYEEAVEEGVAFSFYSSPVEICGEDGHVKGLKIEKQNILEDGSMEPTGEFDVIPADHVIIAIGYKPDTMLYTAGAAESDAIACDKYGYIATPSETHYGMTSRPGVFAAGDVVTEPDTVVVAMREGKRTAPAILQYIQEKRG